jgi:hypothetical protein
MLPFKEYSLLGFYAVQFCTSISTLPEYSETYPKDGRADSSKTLKAIYETTRRQVTESSHLHVQIFGTRRILSSFRLLFAVIKVITLLILGIVS